MPGSCSLWGDDPARHWAFASEVCAERLIRRYVHPSGKLAWDWGQLGENHFCDVMTNIFAMASWFRMYDALPRVLDAAAVRPMSADLFDPRVNPTINENAERGEETPGLPDLATWRAQKTAPVRRPVAGHKVPRKAKRWVRK